MSVDESITNQMNASLSVPMHLFSMKEFKNTNIVFSPLLLHVALSIIAAGSKDPTKRQLLSFLGSKSTSHLNSFASRLFSDVLSDTDLTGGPHLSFANGVWVEQFLTLQPSFKQLLATHYKATLASVDFLNKADEVTEEVNLWVEKKTNGLIKNLLPPGSVDDETSLIFANALYFKGAWKDRFIPWRMNGNDFHLLNGSSVKVPFMTGGNRQFVSAFDGFKVLGLPYKQGQDKRKFSMYFFLPDAKDGLPALVEKVASESGFLERNLPHKENIVGKFGIPRFNISFGVEISDVLKELGVVLPFTGGDLTKILVEDSRELRVSGIFQKAFIEVNEHGTVAAAAGCIRLTGGGACTLIDFVADHPFLFLIREDLTGTILFIGQVLNPLAG